MGVLDESDRQQRQRIGCREGCDHIHRADGIACDVLVWVMDLTLLEEQGWHTEELR